MGSPSWRDMRPAPGSGCDWLDDVNELGRENPWSMPRRTHSLLDRRGAKVERTTHCRRPHVKLISARVTIADRSANLTTRQGRLFLCACIHNESGSVPGHKQDEQDRNG